MEFKEPIVLWKSVIGSHLWGMHRSDSDIDYFKCYQFDSRSFLLGNTHIKGHQFHGEEIDISSFEIGHVIHYLLLGNVNFLWGTMSSQYKAYESSVFHKLRRIVRKTVAKNCIHSIRGFVIHNLRHWLGMKVKKLEDGTYDVIEQTLPRLTPLDKKYWKIINTCGRTLVFGMNLMESGRFIFEPRGACGYKELLDSLKDLDSTWEISKLPEEPDPTPYQEFLLELRLKNLGC